MVRLRPGNGTREGDALGRRVRKGACDVALRSKFYWDRSKSDMEFGILGPLEVVEDGRPSISEGRRAGAARCSCCWTPNQVVPADRLVDALWEDEPPETAKKALQVYVSRLRKALGKERLETQAPGLSAPRRR